MKNGKALIIAAFVIAVAGILFLTSNHHGGSATTATPTGTGDKSGGAGPAVPTTQTEITLVYSTEKQAWIEEATGEFAKANPDVKVTLVGKGSLDAAEAIVDGSLKPTLFSPADSMVMNLLAEDWQTKTGDAIFAGSGDDAPQPLVLTPLVFVAWEDRGDALTKAGNGAITWKGIHDAVTSNQGWPAVGGKAEWGFVKLGHTDPTRSNSGLMSLLLMSYEFYGKNRGLTVDDLLKPDYQKYVKEIESGVGKFEPSTGTFMVDMVRFGPSKYDIAVVYENLAIQELADAQGRWGNLKVYYPATTLWSDHPIALLAGGWVTPAQQAAARRYVAFLRSKPMQERALRFGFRPADTSVPVKTSDPANPWTRLAPFGVKVDVPAAAEVPDGNVVRNLMTMWTRVVGAH